VRGSLFQTTSYRTDRYPGRKGGTAVAVNHVDLPPFVSVEATGVCIPIGNSEVLLAAVYKSPGRVWSDADTTKVVSFKRKSVLAGDLNAKHRFRIVQFQTLQARNCYIYLTQTNSKFQHRNAPLIIPLREMVTCWIV
jgi:hypothetical protein